MKTLELADLHLDPKWFDLQKPCLNLIVETVKKEKIDSVCIAGDIYNRPVYNSDKDRFSFVLDFIELLSRYTSIIMIPGTPGHDAPGSYEIFKKMGCHVLNPARPEIINGILFIGMPEINKIAIMRQNKLNINEANIKISEQIEKLIKNIWVPIRQDNKDKPCIFLGHGMFLDNINEKNPIAMNSDVLIDNKLLKEINADRYIFGHIHTPSESKILNGGYVGYMGFDNHPWNNTGFQPGFNLTEIGTFRKGGLCKEDLKKIQDGFCVSDFPTNTTRIDFPVVRKEKIKCTFDKVPDLSKYKNYDVRLKIKTTKTELRKQDIKKLEKDLSIAFSLNSCEIIPDIIKEESSRITKEQSDNAKTLWGKYCLFKGWKHPQNHESYMKKINEIENNVSIKSKNHTKKIVKLLSLKIHGSIFSIDAQNKNTFFHDFSKDPSGLTLIKGDNGEGKSTFFGFAVTHPVFIGWDYRSLKEFFPDDGFIEKIFDVNGKIHRHYISVKKNKIECFWYVKKNNDWEAISETASIKDFYQKCDDFFGSLDTFISTSFYSQEPWRMKKYVSSLTSSTITELRNAYMNIVGIDRAAEKEYAKQKKDKIEKKIEKLETEKNVISNFMADQESIQEEKIKLEKEINEIKNDLLLLTNKFNIKNVKFSEIEKQHEKQKEIENKIKFNNQAIKDMESNKNLINEKIRRLEKINISELKQQIKDNDDIKKEIELLNEDLRIGMKRKNKIDNNKKEIEKTNNIIKNKLTINEMLNEPCEKCGHIKKESQEKIDINKSMIDNWKKDIEKLKSEIKNIDIINIKAIEEQLKKQKLQLLSEEKIAAINNSIIQYSQIEIYKKQLEKNKQDIEKIKIIITELKEKQNEFISLQYDKIKIELQGITEQVNIKTNELTAKSTLLQSIEKQLEKISENKEKYNQILSELDSFVIDHTEWEIIEKDMMSNKLPALELEIIAAEIDFEVNQKLNEKFIIKTNTQYINKKGEVVDAFDILVYNPRSGIEKSILAHSPGQRAAYFNEPISQALRNKRQEKENIIFMWSVADETDNPIKHSRVKDYYEIMNQSLPEGHTRFIMSQKSEVYQFIRNSIDIKEIGVNK